jgi:Flp pilus assembly protein TadD
LSDSNPFSHREHDIYLVSRIDAFTVDEAKALVDRAGRTAREGQIVLDQRDSLVNRLGENWLGLAAQNLVKAGHSERVVLETTPKPARDVTPVMGYFSWGSADPQNRVRTVKMDFVPGAIGASFVSTDARTFNEPPPAWVPTNTNDRNTWFAGSPQSLVGDLIREGLTGVAGQVAEPYLQSAVRPDVLFPAYLAGFNLVESFYLSIPHLSWQTVVIGDPLCTPFARRTLTRVELEGGLDEELKQPAFFAKRRVEQAAASLPGESEEAARLWVRAEDLLRARDRDGARLVLEKVSELAPKAAGVQILLAELYTVAGEPELAAARYRQALALQPNNATALNNLAYDIAVRQNKPAEALPMARKALSLAPTNATIMDTVGWIEFLLGNNAEASRILGLAAKGAPKNAEVRLHNALALAAQGARAAAATELAAALELDPELEKRQDVRELRGRLPPQN